MLVDGQEIIKKEHWATAIDSIYDMIDLKRVDVFNEKDGGGLNKIHSMVRFKYKDMHQLNLVFEAAVPKQIYDPCMHMTAILVKPDGEEVKAVVFESEVYDKSYITNNAVFRTWFDPNKHPQLCWEEGKYTLSVNITDCNKNATIFLRLTL